MSYNRALGEAIANFYDGDSELRLLSDVLELDSRQVNSAIKELRRYAFFSTPSHDRSDHLSVFYPLPRALVNCLCVERHDSFIAMSEYLAPAASPTHLSMKDFGHVDIDILMGVLQSAIANDEVGVNILIYGPPGTGKTELTKVLAKQLEVALYEVKPQGGDLDSDADEYEHGNSTTSPIFALSVIHQSLLKSWTGIFWMGSATA